MDCIRVESLNYSPQIWSMSKYLVQYSRPAILVGPIYLLIRFVSFFCLFMYELSFNSKSCEVIVDIII